LKGVFLQTNDPANVVGDGVLDAIRSAEESGLKGPRLLASQKAIDAAQGLDRDLVERIAIPTAMQGVWDVLWLLPARAEDLRAPDIACVGGMAVRYLGRWGGDPRFGAHYREFVLLVLKSEIKLRTWSGPRRRVTPFLDRRELRRVMDSVTGLSEDFHIRVE
jgi:hypothetical protein